MNKKQSHCIIYQLPAGQYVIIDRRVNNETVTFDKARVTWTSDIFKATRFKLESTVPSVLKDAHRLKAVYINVVTTIEEL